MVPLLSGLILVFQLLIMRGHICSLLDQGLACKRGTLDKLINLCIAHLICCQASGALSGQNRVHYSKPVNQHCGKVLQADGESFKRNA